MSPHPISDNAFFAFLLDEGLLSEMEIRDLARKASTDCMPLGQILVRHRIITVQALMKALTYQDEEPSTRLGEVCVRLGLCTEAQIEAALKLQARSAPHGLLVLLNEYGNKNADLVCALATYVSGLEHRESMASQLAEDLQKQVDELSARLNATDAA